jgi:hypothetical protein
MDVPRIIAGGLAVSRIAFGAGLLTRPRLAGAFWIGRAANRPGTQVIVRSQAARDLGLGLGGLSAVGRARDADASRWMAAYALADGVDTVTTWAARDRLPAHGVKLALALAAGTAIPAVLAAIGLRRAPPPGAPRP